VYVEWPAGIGRGDQSHACSVVLSGNFSQRETLHFISRFCSGLYHEKMNRTLTSMGLRSLLVLVHSVSSDRLTLKYTQTLSVFILIQSCLLTLYVFFVFLFFHRNGAKCGKCFGFNFQVYDR